MKIHMDLECTPEEARKMLGLPDVEPMQKAMMTEVETRMKKALSAMEPDALFRMWLPAGLQSLENWQKFIWSNMSRAMSRGRDGEPQETSDRGEDK